MPKSCRLLAVPSLLLACLGSGITQAQSDEAEHARTRGRLEQAYVDELSRHAGIYQSAPITHVVPSFKTVTFALAGTKYDVLGKNNAADFSGRSLISEQTLHVTGYSVAPYVAVSLKKIGLGFSAEVGKRRADYALWSGKTGTLDTAEQTQRSDMEHRAVGVYGYFLPFASEGERKVILSTMIGVKTANVTHLVSPINWAGSAQYSPAMTALEKFRYNVTEYEFGTLLEYRLLKKFSLMPWADYTYVDVHDPVAQADDILKKQEANQVSASTAACLKGDAYIFWRARPRLDFGLDFALHLFGVAFHLGDVFGAMVNKHDSDVIKNSTLYVSLSTDMRGE